MRGWGIQASEGSFPIYLHGPFAISYLKGMFPCHFYRTSFMVQARSLEALLLTSVPVTVSANNKSRWHWGQHTWGKKISLTFTFLKLTCSLYYHLHWMRILLIPNILADWTLSSLLFTSHRSPLFCSTLLISWMFIQKLYHIGSLLRSSS